MGKSVKRGGEGGKGEGWGVWGGSGMRVCGKKCMGRGGDRWGLWGGEGWMWRGGVGCREERGEVCGGRDGYGEGEE